MKTKSGYASKPRDFRSLPLGGARGSCGFDVSGDRVVDTSIDLYDDKSCVRELVRYSRWLAKAASWLKEKNS